MPAAAIKHNWMAGAFPPTIEKLLVAISNIRPRFSTVAALHPRVGAVAAIRRAIAATLARIRHDPPGD